MSRWFVTYTKHITQKRKVYHDGTLELCSSGDKVVLYDDCQKIIDSRFLKKDEVVEHGGLLTFATHLADIGDPEACHMSLGDLNVGGERVKLNEKAGSQKHKPNYLGHKKSTLESLPSKKAPNSAHGSVRDLLLENNKSTLQNKAVQDCPDSIPSNIRVLKQNEHRRTELLQSCPDEIPTSKEWYALYTTQVTQKAKKYHDGILRLSSCGAYTNQVTLLSEEGTILSSKFLKSVECMKTGYTFELPNYLVEICELRAPLADIKEHSESIAHRISSDDSDLEWAVLYTAQMTKKAKVYHDGILRVINAGSHMKQVVLLSEDENVLSSKYLKLAEGVKTGNKFDFPNYMVEICARRTLLGGDYLEGSDQVAGSRRISTEKSTNGKNTYNSKSHPKDVQTVDLETASDVKSEVGRALSLNNCISHDDIKKDHSEPVVHCISPDDSDLENHNSKQLHNEWNVLYTAQMTKKAKVYNDGILRVTSYGSHMKQVVLLSEDGSVLGSKYAKSAEGIKTGNKFEFPNYLVEICERRTTEGGGTLEQVAGSGRRSAEKPLNNKETHSCKSLPKDERTCNLKSATDVISEVGKAVSLNNITRRDANQILFSLKRPVNISRSADVNLLHIDSKRQKVDVSFTVTMPSINQNDDNDKDTVIIDYNSGGKSPTHGCSISPGKLSGSLAPNISTSKPKFQPADVQNGRVIGSSCSSLEENVVAENNRSLSEEIIMLHQEWVSLSHQVSVIGNTKSPVRFGQDDTVADGASKTSRAHAPSPARVAASSLIGSSELECIPTAAALNMADCPSFDLGFD